MPCIADHEIAGQSVVGREGLKLHDYFRYVDDVRNCLQVLMEGWKWNGMEFEFRDEWMTEDLNSEVSDLRRTSIEVSKAMSSLVSYLVFEYEDAEMFKSNKLPTLDTSLWWDGSKILHEFYEKPTVSNRVLQKDTALSINSIYASLNQDVVRRLLLCSQELAMSDKQAILSAFAQKLLNSGFSLASTKITLVHGTSKYLELLRNSKLPHSSQSYKPLYYDKSFKRLERTLSKFDAKSGWYTRDGQSKSGWRSRLPVEWRGSKPLQRKVPGIPYTTLLQVPNSKGGGC